MAKLLLSIDCKFTTEALKITDKESFQEVSLDREKGKALFGKVDKDELAVEVVSSNEDAQAAFPIFIKNGKKGAIFTAEPIDGGVGLAVVVSGDFSIDLRSGVATMLKSVGEDLDLRIRGVMWKGGAYSGFMASVAGGDFEQESSNWAESFPKPTSFSIK